MSNKTTSWILEFIDKISAPLRSVQGAADGAADAVDDVSEAVTDLDKSSSKLGDLGAKIGAGAFVFNQISESLNKVNTEIQNLITPGARFQSQMADLSAVTLIFGDDLDKIGQKAKNLADEFGGSASDYVESFKDIVARFGPVVAKNDKALEMMGRNVAILSKLMGGDAKAATDALTTAMLQYGVDLKDPIKASKEMAEIMNILVAGGNAGASEVRDTAEALKIAGLQAKMSGLSIADLTSATQAFAQGSIVGSEAGTSLFNILRYMSSEALIPADVVKDLKNAGVNLKLINDPTVKFTDRLRELKKVAKTDMIDRMFNRYSSDIRNLIDLADQQDQWTQEIQGTNAALDGANIIMDTYNEKQSRTAAWIENLKIGFFNVMEPIAPFTNLISGAMEGVFTFGAAVWGLSIIFKKDLWVGIGQGIAAMSKWIAVNTVAVGKTIITTIATWGLNAAFWSNPITWVVAGIVLFIGSLVILWNKVEGFRAAITGMWEVLKSFGNIIKEFIIDRITGILKGIGALGQALVKLFKGDFKGAWESAKEGASGIIGVDAYKNAYNSAKGLGESYEKGAADGRAAYKKAHGEDKPVPLVTGFNMPTINPLATDAEGNIVPLNERFSTNKKVGFTPFIEPKNSVVKTPATKTNSKTNTTDSTSGSGSGSGKSVTMHLTINNYLQGIKNPDEFVEIVVRKINDRLNDSLALI